MIQAPWCAGVESCAAAMLRDPNILGKVKSVAEVVAIVIGGWWTYSRFVRNWRAAWHHILPSHESKKGQIQRLNLWSALTN